MIKEEIFESIKNEEVSEQATRFTNAFDKNSIYSHEVLKSSRHTRSEILSQAEAKMLQLKGFFKTVIDTDMALIYQQIGQVA